MKSEVLLLMPKWEERVKLMLRVRKERREGRKTANEENPMGGKTGKKRQRRKWQRRQT